MSEKIIDKSRKDKKEAILTKDPGDVPVSVELSQTMVRRPNKIIIIISLRRLYNLGTVI